MLGVTPRASDRQIRDAYYELARQHHDKGNYSPEFAEITEAHGVLSNRERRKAYDAKRTFLRKACATCKGEGCTYKTIGFTKRKAVLCAACGGTGLA